MTIKTCLKLSIALAASATASQVSASNIFYHFDVDTSALAGNPNAPFALDFQLTDGDGLNNSFVTIKNFDFSGGNAIGTPELINGANGDLSTAVSLTDSEFYNDFFQEFSSGGKVSFDVAITSTATGVTPDGFGFGIGSAADGGLSFFDVFAVIDLNNNGQIVNSFSLDGVTASVRVPETASLANLPIGLAALGLFGYLAQDRKKKIIA